MLSIEILKFDTFNSARGINSSQSINIEMPPKNGDKERTKSAPPITTVQTENVQLALAKPNANAPITINHTSNVIRKSSAQWGLFIMNIVLQ